MGLGNLLKLFSKKKKKTIISLNNVKCQPRFQ